MVVYCQPNADTSIHITVSITVIGEVERRSGVNTGWASTERLSENRLERFLVEWANLPEIPAPPKGRDGRDDVESWVYAALDRLICDFPEFELGGGVTMSAGQDLLRKAWTAPDQRSREWYLFMLRASYQMEHQQSEHLEGPPLMISSDLDPPPFTPFEQAIAHLQHRLHAALYCKWRDCQTPYFLRRERRDQCCSDRCTNLFREEYRRRWWQDKGKARRMERQAVKRKSNYAKTNRRKH
jgi:hypothetical protein